MEGLYSYNHFAQSMSPYAPQHSNMSHLHSPPLLLSQNSTNATSSMAPPPPPHLLSPRSKYGSQRPLMGSFGTQPASPPQAAMPKVGSATPTGSTGAAPGPIPATTPVHKFTDSDGIPWIIFEYSRDRAKIQYTIRCDISSVDIDNLSTDFKTENCVYPRAFCKPDDYKGNRLIYETECNKVGWALAELNKQVQGRRGLIQRAVDSWRNSNENERLQSRRVRRLNKMQKRKNSHPALASGQRHHHQLAVGAPAGCVMPHDVAAGARLGGLQLVPHHQSSLEGGVHGMPSPHPACGDDVNVNAMYQQHV
ncbi:hypothetical protein KEM52_000809 [Ascosphaera acerosa]|nr:hypothetical protein KEM52_000809 [Ascosphaera acerosa]